MISEVDDGLRGLVRRAVQGSEVDVVLDAPTKDWAARRNAPTVNLYLYDVREDLRRRQRGFHDHRGSDGAVEARLPPPRHFRLSYLVTAWTQRPEDEHQLLDSVLRLFLPLEALPRELVAGALAEARLPIPLFVGLPPPEDRGFADVWSALGGELKPSLDVVVVAPMVTGALAPFGKPVTENLRLDAEDLASGTGDERRQLRPAVPADGPPPRVRRRR